MPRLARLYGQAKEFGLTVMMHSCGGIRPFVPDMIAAGMEVLDPVQVRAEIQRILEQNAAAPLGGLAGPKLVNVLEVNLQLRAHYGAPAA